MPRIVLVFVLLVAAIGGIFYLGRSTVPTPPSNPVQVKDVTKLSYISGGDVTIFDLKTNQEKKITNYGYNTSPILSPDSSKVAYLSVPDIVVQSENMKKFSGKGFFNETNSFGGEQNVWIINTDGTDPIQVTKDPKPRTSLTWSADNTKISFQENGQIIEYDLNSKEITPLKKGTNLVYSPNGEGRALIIDDDKTLQVFNKGSEQSYRQEQTIANLDWSNKNKIFFTSIGKVDGPT